MILIFLRILSPVSVLVSASTLAFASTLYSNLDNWWPFSSKPSQLWVYAIVCALIFLYLLPMMTPAILCLASITLGKAIVHVSTLVIMMHALLRQRNTLNKMTRIFDSNAPDHYKSPMGLLLGQYGEQ